MMQVRQQLDHLSPEMEGLKEDIEFFRKAADHYEFHRIKEAEQIVNCLLYTSILTLDPVPADDKEYEKYRTHMMIYSDLINISVGYSDR